MNKKTFTPVCVHVDVNSKSVSLEKLQILLPVLKKVSEAYSGLKQGSITEEIFLQLVNKPSLVREAAMDQATRKAGDNEMLQEMSIEWVNARFEPVLNAMDTLKKQFSNASHSTLYNVLIQVDFFGFDSAGNPFIKESVDKQLEDHFSIFLNSQEDVELMNSAKDAVNALEKLRVRMLQAGYQLDAIDRLVGDTGLIVERDYNKFQIDYETFDFWRSKMRQANLKTA